MSGSDGQVFFDTVEGRAYTRNMMDLDMDEIREVHFGFLDAKMIKLKVAEKKGSLKGY